MSDVTFVVPRSSSEEMTVAIVHATLTKAGEAAGLRDEATFLAALVRAVTRWVVETDEGAKRWQDSAEDFNIGDLAALSDMEVLQVLDRSDGLIGGLGVHTHCQLTYHAAWTFDTVLVDKELLDG